LVKYPAQLSENPDDTISATQLWIIEQHPINQCTTCGWTG
jgi:hypothetical protein